MLKINIYIDNETRKSIKNIYGTDDYGTVATVVNDIISRYVDVEHFDPKLNVDRENDYKICKFCEEKSKHSRIIDTDGTNLEERDVCENCGSGHPALL